MVLDGVKVVWSLWELTGSEHYEFGSGHCGLRWHHVSSFSKIKRKKGLDSMHYVIRRMPEGLASRAQKMACIAVSHFLPFPSHIFIIASLTSRWRHSTILFACELYGEMQM
jgi:hypothetical protein